MHGFSPRFHCQQSLRGFNGLRFKRDMRIGASFELLVLPLVHGVWWKSSTYSGMVAHCLINLIGAAITFARLLG